MSQGRLFFFARTLLFCQSPDRCHLLGGPAMGTNDNERLQMKHLDQLPRCSLGFFPTPLVALPRLTERMGGPRLYMKRDDQSGLAIGGNKVRKLEFLFGEALSTGADCVITGGAAQSNHCRQTAAAAARLGMECHLALGGEEPDCFQGNLLLDRLLGAHLHWCGEDRKGEQIPALVEQLKERGKTPYVIPYGGSNGTGALGFVGALRELQEQRQAQALPAFTHVVFASSSGGTHAGLLAGCSLLRIDCQLIGIGIDKEDMGGESLSTVIVRLADEVLHRLDAAVTPIAEVTLEMSYAEPGYGVVGDVEREALSLVAATEGILLDPVYTGRAMGGLLDLIRNRRLTSEHTVLFWHTGGTPALFSSAHLFHSAATP